MTKVSEQIKRKTILKFLKKRKLILEQILIILWFNLHFYRILK